VRDAHGKAPALAHEVPRAVGADVGEASYAVVIKPEEIIHVAGVGRMRVRALVPVPKEDSPFTGFLEVEPLGNASGTNASARPLATEPRRWLVRLNHAAARHLAGHATPLRTRGGSSPLIRIV